MISTVEPGSHVAVGIVPPPLKLCWYRPPLSNARVAPLFIVTVPAERKVPATDRSVAVPSAMVSVTALLSVTWPPASMVTSSTVTLAATVTVWPFWMVTTPDVLDGEVTAATHAEPSQRCHVAAVAQLPDAADR